MNNKKNRLSLQKSPYLIQHQYNPVDWYAWEEEAFEKAHREDKPVFLSIGYSTCHWCHVMEHESFENDDVAAVLNEGYISIKVDREERPDIDKIYMTVCQMMTGSGGWPLTIIMTPEKKPFFAGTYIPREPRGGRPGLVPLLHQIRRLWLERRKEVEDSADEITSMLNREDEKADGSLASDVIGNGAKMLKDSYDRIHGGFGTAPKFPSPHNLMFLLRRWHASEDNDARDMALETLRKMRMGGIYDQLGFGFHRYSTDPQWLAPHFEKMLYDQAMTGLAFLEAFQVTGDAFFASTGEEIFTYVMRDLSSPGGGFYSAEDADSEGREGAFYVWTAAEAGSALKSDDIGLFESVFNINKQGNFREEATGKMSGENILHIKSLLPDELFERLEPMMKKLLEIRNKRERPHRDEKILTDWNSLMAAALARGYAVLGREVYRDRAVEVIDFIETRLADQEGRLLHSFCDGEAAHDGNLDDYAYYLWALLELYGATFEARYLQKAVSVSDSIIGLFHDPESGILYFTPRDGEKLIARPRELYDGAWPSGFSVALYSMSRLARMSGNTDLENLCRKLLDAAAGEIARHPSGYAMSLMALQFLDGPSREIVIAGDAKSPEVQDMTAALRKTYLPDTVIIINDGDEIFSDGKFPALEGKVTVDGKAAAYVCSGSTCREPVYSVKDLMKLVNEKE